MIGAIILLMPISLWTNHMKTKILLGSKLLKLNNCRDEDWRVYYRDQDIDSVIRDMDDKTIRRCFYVNALFEEMTISDFMQKKYIHHSPYKALALYQLSKGFHENISDYPLQFNILKHKEAWIETLKSYINSEETEKFAFKKNYLSKKFYHLLYQYYMIVEDTHWISKEAKEKVQKIHDLEMPSSYFYELRDLINSL